MPELSPAARSVFESFNREFEWIEDGVPGPQFRAIAAAIYSVADQVIPVPIKSQTPDEHWALLGVKNRLLAIADELMADTYTISAEDNDVTELVKDVADKVDGVTVKFKEGGHIRMTGDAKIVISDGRISL